MYNPEIRLRTTLVDHHEIDIAGVTAVLGRFADRVSLVDPDVPEVDVVLYGVRERHAAHDAALHALLRTTPATVIVLGWGAGSPQSSGHSPVELTVSCRRRCRGPNWSPDWSASTAAVTGPWPLPVRVSATPCCGWLVSRHASWRSWR